MSRGGVGWVGGQVEPPGDLPILPGQALRELPLLRRPFPSCHLCSLPQGNAPPPPGPCHHQTHDLRGRHSELCWTLSSESNRTLLPATLESNDIAGRVTDVLNFAAPSIEVFWYPVTLPPARDSVWPGESDRGQLGMGCRHVQQFCNQWIRSRT